MKKLLSKKISILITIIFVVTTVLLVYTLSLNAAPVTVGSFVVDYGIQYSWGSGATVNVKLSNNGSAVQSWTVGWTFPGNHQITNMWIAAYTQSGSSVTVKNSTWNGTIPTNGSQSFGFNLTYSGTNSAPTSFTVNSSSSGTTTTIPVSSSNPTTTYIPATTNVPTTTTSIAPSGSVYLCFDDGPNSNSQTLVNALKSAGCNQATLFVWGNRISSNSSAWSAYTSSGFSLQNHSWTHSHMTGWSYQQVYNDLQQCTQAIQNAGKPKPTKIRLPYLESNSTIQQACSALGLSIVSPSVDTKDWNGASTQSIVSACNSLQSGGNPLMHDGYSTTNAAIPTIVQNLKSRGLGFAQY